jgi:hypothetical protein
MKFAVRRSGVATEAARRRGRVCSSNLGVLRRVCVLPEELDGREGMREDCWRCWRRDVLVNGS